jgi:uncharacterized phiE125 gp8 family phage protein
MNLRLITAPLVTPVSLETAKLYLRVDHTAEDTLITSLIKAATQKGEELARRAFITQTWEMTLDEWPSGYCLRLYRPPLQSVTSVKYLDGDSVEHSWTDYAADTRNEPGVIIFNTLPSSTLLESGAISVRYVAGYGDAAANVPDNIQNAILALVAYWYENRQSQNVPVDIRGAFIAERVVWF